MFSTIVSRTKRVPVVSGQMGNGASMTRQLDVALLKVGFKLSGELFRHLEGQSPALVKDVANRLIPVVESMVGAHHKHNTYFKNFPVDVPDTEEFWLACIREALGNLATAAVVGSQVAAGQVNLLDLPSYGKYLHSYEDMVRCHEEYLPSMKETVKVLHLGKSLQEETVKLYHQLAGSSVPLNEDDRKLILELTELCLDEVQPVRFPVRENKAVVNSVRVQNQRPILADTVTDVLRLACALSGGDVTLVEKTKFKSLSRKVRRSLLGALDTVIAESPEKMVDMNRHLEAWKRLGERLHPHESKLPAVKGFFALVRGEENVTSTAGRVEKALASKDLLGAIRILGEAPGMLFRSLDRIIMLCGEDTKALNLLMQVVSKVVSKVSGRVILSVWEHLMNRSVQGSKRLFSNTKGKTWVTDETRRELPSEVITGLVSIFKTELRARFAKMGISGLQVDPDMLDVALPLTEKNKSSGFGIMPKGSVIPVRGDTLRFFMYWKQKSERTDYDLAAFFMTEEYQNAGHCSWTSLRHGEAGDVVHSGDITSAPNGASEFINMKLGKVKTPYIVAQINRYAGEDFQDIEENLFGFMELDASQKGQPFEAKAVKVKAEIRGKGQVAIPAIFMRRSDNTWACKWLDLQLTGHPNMNTIEGNKLTTAMLMKAAVERVNLTIRDLLELLPGANTSTTEAYVGFQKPENLAPDTKVFTLDNLTGLIPE